MKGKKKMNKNENKVYYKNIEKEAPIAPTVTIDEDVYNTMMALVDECDEEVGWLMCVENNGNNYHIYNIYIVEQEVNGTTTELSETALQDLCSKFLNSNNIKDYNNLRCWGHSHVNMSTSPSAQDNETFEEYMKQCGNYFIRIITNKKRQHNVELADYEAGFLFSNIPLKVSYKENSVVAEYLKAKEKYDAYLQENNKKYKEIAKELKGKYVKKKSYTYSNSNYTTSNNKNYTSGNYYNNYYVTQNKKTYWYDDILNNKEKYFKDKEIEDIMNIFYAGDSNVAIKTMGDILRNKHKIFLQDETISDLLYDMYTIE